MYDVGDYWRMMGDRGRRDAYAEALRRTVTPQSVVLNIGTGTGVFALQACQLGAQRVYAIEPSEIIAVARRLADANGFANRIEFIQALSTDVVLPEPVNIVVSDLRGVLPLHEHHIAAIRDARRFLAPGARFIPERDAIFAALVEAPDLYQELVAPWSGHSGGLDFDPARSFATDRWTKVRVRPDHLLVAPQAWITLDYPSIEDASARGDLRWRIERDGEAHGLCAWFVTSLVDGVGFSSGPDEPERIYGSGFFPFQEPVRVAAEDVVTVGLSATLIGDSYLWRWTTRVEDATGSLRSSFDQTNLTSVQGSTLRLARSEATPRRSAQGQIELEILNALDGTTSIQAIAEGLAVRHPERYGDLGNAIRRVQQTVRTLGA